MIVERYNKHANYDELYKTLCELESLKVYANKGALDIVENAPLEYISNKLIYKAPEMGTINFDGRVVFPENKSAKLNKGQMFVFLDGFCRNIDFIRSNIIVENTEEMMDYCKSTIETLYMFSSHSRGDFRLNIDNMSLDLSFTTSDFNVYVVMKGGFIPLLKLYLRYRLIKRKGVK